MAYDLTNAIAEAVVAGRRQGRGRRDRREHVPTTAETRISPALRELLLRRATREIQSETNPAIELLQAQIPQLRQSLQREKQSIKVANEMAGQAVADISLKGLHGQARHQLAEELTQRQADIAASVPFQLTEARSDFKDQKQAVMQDILSAQAEQQQGIAQAYHTALDSARSDVHTRIKERVGRARSRRNEEPKDHPHDQQKELNAALKEAHRLMRAQPQLAAQLQGSTDPAVWAQFEDAIAAAEGIGLTAARKAAERLRRIVERSFADNPVYNTGQGVAGAIVSGGAEASGG